MRRGKRSIVLAVAVAAGLVGPTAPPARAANAGVVQFDVVVSTPPLGFPVSAPGVTGPIAISHQNMCFGSLVGKGIAAGACNINGSGIVHQFFLTSPGADCTTGAGVLRGYIDFPQLGGGTARVTYSVDYAYIGNQFEATGTAAHGQTGKVVVTGTWAPTNPTHCFIGAASQFRLVAKLSAPMPCGNCG